MKTRVDFAVECCVRHVGSLRVYIDPGDDVVLVIKNSTKHNIRVNLPLRDWRDGLWDAECSE